MADPEMTRRVVTAFLREVRFGGEYSRVPELMAETVVAHQIESEHDVTIERSRASYVEHVQELEAMWEESTVDVEEFLVDGARAYVRVSQVGRRRGLDRSIKQTSSIIFEVEEGLITRYWMQVDRAGLLAQLP